MRPAGTRLAAMPCAATMPPTARGMAASARERLAIQVRAAFGDFAQHDRGEERVLRTKPAMRGIDASILRRRAGRRSRRWPRRRSPARAKVCAEQGAVETLLAAEVVVEHRLVDAGAAGDAVDAGAGVAACGELDRGGGEDPVGRDAGRRGH